MMTCIFCKKDVDSKHVRIVREVPGKDPWPRCPHCGCLGAFRTRTALGSVVYCHGSHAGLVYNAISFDHWTPEELEAIAQDLREQEVAGALFFPDGSGHGKAGREEHADVAQR